MAFADLSHFQPCEGCKRSLLRHDIETLKPLGSSRRDMTLAATNSAGQGHRTPCCHYHQPASFGKKHIGPTVGQLSAHSIGTPPHLLGSIQLAVRQSPNYQLGQLNARHPSSFATVAGHQKAGDLQRAAALLATRLSKHHDFCQPELGCALCHFEHKSRPIDNINILSSELLHKPVRFPNLRTWSTIHV